MNAMADPSQLPGVLREPPWLRASRAAVPQPLALPPLAQAQQLRWAVEARESAQRAYIQILGTPGRWSPPEAHLSFLGEVGIRPEARARLIAGAAATSEDFVDPQPERSLWLHYLFALPDVLAASLWNLLPAHRWSDVWDASLGYLVGRYGDAVVPGCIAFALRRPVLGLRAGRWLDSPVLAALALKVRRQMKVARQVATDWLLTNPQTSAGVLLRQLLGADAASREDALAALHDASLAGLRPALDAAARELGPDADTAWQAVRDTDPLLHLPAAMPRLPAYVDPARLHRPRLTDGGAPLPDDALRNLALMLAISHPQSPYAGLDDVRAACTSASLAEFAWDLFEAWWSAGAPSSGAWALPALGLLGDTGTVHRIGARAMRLAREGAKNRAVALVDLLAADGSDAALMHLDHLAERCKVTVVRNRATAQIDSVAEQRGLSRIELADRLVPTLGLGQSRLLDFGPRQFHIGLDETLAPFVSDAQGARLKDLPKPRLSDDRERADAAALRYKQLKADLKTLGRVQLDRLEQAMVTRRRWAPDDFQRFFVQHPLTRELAVRLLWGMWNEAGVLLGAVRIAEDGTLADARDARCEPPANARLGIAHPLELPTDLHGAFVEQFADYNILQPFPQLARETFALTPEEASGTTLVRVDGQEVATGAVIGLLEHGWLRGPTEDGGSIYTLQRPLGPAGSHASLELSPGMPVTRLSAEPRQTLGAVRLRDAERRALPFSLLEPIAVSELLRDLYRLAPSALPSPSP